MRTGLLILGTVVALAGAAVLAVAYVVGPPGIGHLAPGGPERGVQLMTAGMALMTAGMALMIVSRSIRGR